MSGADVLMKAGRGVLDGQVRAVFEAGLLECSL
jgi:hypothetical protein